MIRFVEMFDIVNSTESRKLNLQDMGLGDLSMSIIAEIFSWNKHSSVDLSKNNFTD